MFQQKKLDDLALLFRVFQRDKATFRLIIDKMNPYIKERGKKIMHDETFLKDPILFTEQLIAFKAEIDELVRKSFSDQMQFQTARDVSFQDFMNE